MLGIIGAMRVEIDDIKSLMIDKETLVYSGIGFTTGELMGKECVVAVSGVGKVNAAVCAEIMALVFKVDAIVNTGVAGGIGSEVRIGDIVVATEVAQHDMDTTALGDPRGYLTGTNLNRVLLPTDERLTSLLQQSAADVEDVTTHTGVIVSGDCFVNDKETLHGLKKEFNALACEMESGSVGQVCRLNKIAFGVVRTISDNADSDSHMEYKEFMPEAARQSSALVCRFIELL